MTRKKTKKLPEKPYISCDSCGSTDFYVFGYVGYHGSYNGKHHKLSIREYDRILSYVEFTTCKCCDADTTRILLRKGIIDQTYRLIERDLGIENIVLKTGEGNG